LKPLKLACIAAGVFLLWQSSRSSNTASAVNGDLKTYAGGAPSTQGGKTGTVTLSTDTVISSSPQKYSPAAPDLNFM